MDHPHVADPVAPAPRLSPPLRMAIVGRKGAGKTTLLSHISSAWPSHEPQTPGPLPVTRASNPLIARLFGSRLGVLASRGIRLLSRFARLFHRPVECTTTSLGNNAAVWDPVCGSGAAAVAQAMDWQVDVVLFVTRLDDCRVSRADRLQLVELVLFFGEKVLEKTIFVLTHGWATPPANLKFKDFVRGRRDLLWQYVFEMLPPVEVSHGSGTEQSGERRHGGPGEVREGSLPISEATVAGVGHNSPYGNGGVGNGEFADVPYRSSSSNNRGIEESRHEGDGDVAGQSPAISNVVAAGEATQNGDENVSGTPHEEDEDVQFRIRPDRFDELFGDVSSDDMSVSGLPDDVIGKFWDTLIHPEDKRVFEDSFKPPTIVVELSESCPRNEHGRKTLPDGTAWLPALLTEVSNKAQTSRDWQRDETEITRSPTIVAVAERRPKFWRQLREMLQSLSKDWWRILVAEIAITVLCVQVGTSMKNAKERRRKKLLEAADDDDDDDDVLLEMSDEEYEKITKPGDSERIVIFDDMDEKDRENLGESESDTEFFGSEDSDGDQSNNRDTSDERKAPTNAKEANKT